MKNNKVEWLLRIGIWTLFIGHGVFALQGKSSWVGWISDFTGLDTATALNLLFYIGIHDIIIGFLVLLKPLRIILVWAIIWTAWTAVMRSLPFIGDPIWDTVERILNPLAVSALLVMRGFPENFKDLKSWFK